MPPCSPHDTWGQGAGHPSLSGRFPERRPGLKVVALVNTMTAALTYLALALALPLLARLLRASWRRRRFSIRGGFSVRPMALSGAGGRAFASHVHSLSDLDVGLKLPPRR